MKRMILAFFWLMALPMMGVTPIEEADNAYMKGHYEEAAQKYEEILKEQVNADLFYNLGNTYFRMEDMGNAILNYERALALEPDNADAQFNLEICESKITDHFNTPSEMFFITWLRDFVSSKNANQWGTWGLVLFLCSVCFFGLYKFGTTMSLRKIGFFVGVTAILFSVLANVAAAWSNHSFSTDNRAVVMNQIQLYQSSNVKEEPLRELNVGTIVNVVDQNSRGWLEIMLPNGKTGWVQDANLTMIKIK